MLGSTFRPLAWTAAATLLLCGLAFGQYSYTLGTGFGGINYTTTPSYGSCLEANRLIGEYTEWIYNDFVWVDPTGNIDQHFGTAIRYIISSPGTGECPKTGWAAGSGFTSYIGSDVITVSENPYGQTPIAQIEVPGYINPKFIVVGVVYAPPGSKSSATYAESSLVSSTTDVTQTFSTSSSVETDIKQPGGIFGFIGGTETNSQSYTVSQQSQDSHSVTASVTATSGFTVYGPTDDYLGVDHDFDIIKVWLNPVSLFTVTSSGTEPNGIQWNGYGYSELDTAAPVDIADVPLGCLNGDFPAGQSPCVGIVGPGGIFSRSWAAAENWPTGEGPAIAGADLLSIAKADPWWDCTPSGETAADCPTFSAGFSLLPPQFTISDQQNVAYEQAPPGGQPPSTSYSVKTTMSSDKGLETTLTVSATFGVVDAWEGTSFLKGFSSTLKTSQTLSYKYEVNDQTTVSNTQTGSVVLTGPVCDGDPCTPQYPPASPLYGQAQSFDIFQDNLFGTFVFLPSSY